MKNLIIYYSRKGENYANGNVVNLTKGNTELVAEFIDEAVGATLFEVEPVADYPADYMTCTEVAKKELKENARPELKNYLTDISEYDNIIVAGPCWWGTFPCAVFSALDKLDFKGKNVFPVMTHEGSGLGKSEKSLKKNCKGANVKKGLAVHGADTEKHKDEIMKWAREKLS